MSGTWLGASYVLGRPVTTTELYPHICSLSFTSPRTGQRVWLGRQACAACVQEAHDEHQQQLDLDQLPAVDPDITAAEARRLGEHD